VPKTEMNLGKIENIIGDEGNGLIKKIIIDFIEDTETKTYSLNRLDKLIQKLENSRF
jgi:hypothetical protein